jgi:hypothetical protein
VNGGPLEAVIRVSRISDPQNNTESTFMSDSFGAVNLGETHTLLLAWDGSVMTYGMDGNLRTFDPKPFVAVVKPRVGPFSDIQAHVFPSQDGGTGYIAATFDNVNVNGRHSRLRS